MRVHHAHFSYGKYYEKKMISAPLCIVAASQDTTILVNMAERNIRKRKHVYGMGSRVLKPQ